MVERLLPKDVGATKGSDDMAEEEEHSRAEEGTEEEVTVEEIGEEAEEGSININSSYCSYSSNQSRRCPEQRKGAETSEKKIMTEERHYQRYVYRHGCT